METKKTSKREYAFVIRAASAVLESLKGFWREVTGGSQVEIIDKDKNVLRIFPLQDLPAEILSVLVVHGLKQKLTDDTMISKIGEDGDRLLALDNLWAQLLAGEWEKERVGIARPPEAVIRLVSELKGCSRIVAEASLKEAGKEKWDAIKTAHAKRVAAIEEKIKAERAGAVALDLNDL